METFPAFLMISSVEDAKLIAETLARRFARADGPRAARLLGYLRELEELIHESETQQSASRA